MQQDPSATMPNQPPNLDLLKSLIFQIRSLLAHLRSLLVQILQATGNFRNHKAAHEFQSELKLMVHLYKLMITQAKPITSNTLPLMSRKHPVGKRVVVGGSPVGLNFITYKGSRLVYYGVTKELFKKRRGSKRGVPPIRAVPIATNR